MVEMMVALFLALLVVMALGSLIVMNQRSWAWGQDKAMLQANVTESLEWMARSIRAARNLTLASPQEFSTYDETGTLAHTYRRDTIGGVPRLLQDGNDLVDRRCTSFTVSANADTTSLTLVLQLEDNAGSVVEGMTRATMRNINYEVIIEE
jgi:hypothetical protein